MREVIVRTNCSVDYKDIAAQFQRIRSRNDLCLHNDKCQRRMFVLESCRFTLQLNANKEFSITNTEYHFQRKFSPLSADLESFTRNHFDKCAPIHHNVNQLKSCIVPSYCAHMMFIHRNPGIVCTFCYLLTDHLTSANLCCHLFIFFRRRELIRSEQTICQFSGCLTGLLLCNESDLFRLSQKS